MERPEAKTPGEQSSSANERSKPSGPIRPALFPFDLLRRSRSGNWLINVLILLITTILLLLLAEGLMRWIDGYNLFSPQLTPEPAGYQQWNQEISLV